MFTNRLGASEELRGKFDEAKKEVVKITKETLEKAGLLGKLREAKIKSFYFLRDLFKKFPSIGTLKRFLQ